MRQIAILLVLILAWFSAVFGQTSGDKNRQTGASPALFQNQSQDAEKEIRKALAAWVEAANQRDYASADEIWSADVVGWFPTSDEFTVDAAFVVAGLPKKKGSSHSTYQLKIEEVAVSGSLAAVYDIWTETRHFDGSQVSVQRVIRSSELWRRQPDGKWKIARWVSAPEKWVRVNE